MPDDMAAVGSRGGLGAALEAQQLTLHFQPVVELRTAKIRGVEALLRWDHPTHGLLPAAAFLPAVEGAPVMRHVTRFALTEACVAVAHDAPPSWTVSVNVTGEDAGSDALVHEVSAALELSGLAPERLVLEVTETGLLDGADTTTVLTRLQQQGVRVSLDDFGSGHSSLRLLREWPISELKIDALFVREMEKNQADAAIVANVISLAGAFDVAVVAEGVEQRSQAMMLQRLGCSYGQGYLWSRPAPLSQLTTLDLRTHRAPGDKPSQAVLDRIQQLLATGASSHSIAAALNAEGLRNPDGRRWHPRSVDPLRRDLEGGD